MKSEYTTADLESLGQKWLERIRLSEEREKTWRESAEKAESAYLAGCDKEGDSPDAPEFNIIHSNVETIVPSIYNSAGKPDIRPRHNNQDPISKVVSSTIVMMVRSRMSDTTWSAPS